MIYSEFHENGSFRMYNILKNTIYLSLDSWGNRFQVQWIPINLTKIMPHSIFSSTVVNDESLIFNNSEFWERILKTTKQWNNTYIKNIIVFLLNNFRFIVLLFLKSASRSMFCFVVIWKIFLNYSFFIQNISNNLCV